MSIVALMTLLAGGATDAVAQPTSGGLTGVVRDQSGAPVGAATVSVLETFTNLSRTVLSSVDGRYAVPGLPPGLYRVAISSPGFRPLAQEGIRLATGETFRLDFELAVGDL